MTRPVDPYLQAAEGFLHAVRDDIDKLELRLEDSLKITVAFTLVSLARSMREVADAYATQGSAGQPTRR